MKKNNNFLIGLIFAGINSLSLGIVGIVDKIGVSQPINPFIFSTQSVIFSFLFVTFFSVFYFKKSLIQNLKSIEISSWKLIFLIGIFASGIFLLLRSLGLMQSTGTFATLSQVIVTSETALLAGFFLKEKFSKEFWLLFIIILIAMYFVSIGKFEFVSLKTGDLYIISATIFLATGNILSRIVVNKVNPILLGVGRFFLAAVFLLIINVFIFEERTSIFTIHIWSIISGLLWGINIVVYAFAISYIGVTLATSLLMIAPIYTMILEYFILKQTFNPIQITAAIIVVVSGILMVATKKKKII